MLNARVGSSFASGVIKSGSQTIYAKIDFHREPASLWCCALSSKFQYTRL